jgi:hypothetical protein
MNGERTPRQIRLLTALLLFGTFLLGAVAGAGLSHWNRFPPPRRPGHPPFIPGPPGALGLTPEQQVKANAITQRYRPELEAIWREEFPKVKAVNDKMEKELREVLTPEQRKTLDEMKAHRPPMPPGGPMGPGGPPPGGPPPPGAPGMPPPGGPHGGGPPPWPPGMVPPPPPDLPK